MYPYNEYPYSDAHELNLDWIIKTVKHYENIVNDFVAFNKLIWAGSWDGNKTYVKWSIVQDGSGDGYLAIQAVPANVPLTNTNYWVMVANYSALYAAFNSRITALESEMAAVEDNLGLLNNRRYVFFLDSYGLVRNGVTPFVEKMRPVIENADQDNFYVFAVGGAGWVTEGSPGKHAIEIILENYASVPDRDTITDIFMNFGINDLNELDYTEISNQITACNAACRTYFPNAKIHYGFMGNKRGKSAAEQKQLITLIRTCYGTAQACNWITCDGLEYVMHDVRNISTDNVHPSDTGSTILARFVLDYLVNGSPIYRAIYTGSANFKDLENNLHPISQVMDGNTEHTLIEPNGSMTAISITGNTWAKIGSLSGSIFDYSSGRAYPITIATREGGTIPAVIQIDTNRDVYIYIPQWSTSAITGITFARIEFKELTLFN